MASHTAADVITAATVTIADIAMRAATGAVTIAAIGANIAATTAAIIGERVGSELKRRPFRAAFLFQGAHALSHRR